MSSEWRTVRVGDLGRIVTGKTPRTTIKENFGGKIPFLTPSDDMSAKYVRKTKRTLSEQGVAEVAGKVLPANSIAVSCIGSNLGKVTITTTETVTNQQINSIIPFESYYDTDFVYYAIKILGERLNFLSKTSTAVPIINKTQFSNETIRVPPLPIQKAISGTLACLDAKIEINNRITANLEQQAQAIFKSWFVDFEPFKDGEFVDSSIGPIPDGWIVKALDEVADYVNGLAMQRYRPQDNEEGLPVIKIRELRQGFADESSDRCTAAIEDDYVIDDGDIVFSWSGTLMVDIWTGGRAGLNQHLFKVSSRNYPRWFYYLWTKFHIEYFRHIADSRATTMGHIKRSHLKEAKVLVPDAISLEWMTALMEPLIDMQMTRRMENRVLASLRDVLRPALLSGEIEVPVVYHE